MKFLTPVIAVILGIVVLCVFRGNREKKPTPVIPREVKIPQEKAYAKPIQEQLDKHIDVSLKKEWNGCKSLLDSVVIATKGRGYGRQEINNYLDGCERYLSGGDWNGKHFYSWDIKTQLEIIASYLVKNKGIAYDTSAKNPDAYLISHLLKNGTGNCTTMPILFALVAERMRIPVSVVTAKDHVFCRYTSGSHTLNIECTSGGVGVPDEKYIKDLDVHQRAIAAGIDMRSLSVRETLGMLYANELSHHLKKNDSSQIKKLLSYVIYLYPKDTYTTLLVTNHFNITGEEKQLEVALVNHMCSFGMKIKPKRSSATQDASEHERDFDPTHYSQKMQKEQDEILRKNQEDVRRREREMFSPNDTFNQ